MLWDSLSPPWHVCLEEAWAAYRAGSIPIGAAVTDGAERVISRGRNRIFEAVAEPPFLAGHWLAHAEVNALLGLHQGCVDPRACTLYTTTEPCPLCTGAIHITRVRQVRYAARDPASGSIALLEATPVMRRHAIRAVGPLGGDVEAIVVALHIEFVLRTDPARWASLVDRWEVDLADGVRLGRELYASDELRRLSDEDTSASEVIDRLRELLDQTRRRTDRRRDG